MKLVFQVENSHIRAINVILTGNLLRLPMLLQIVFNKLEFHVLYYRTT